MYCTNHMFLALKTYIKSKNSPYVGPNSLLHNELRRSDPGGTDECDLAKQELRATDTDEELDVAIQKVRVLCED